MPSESSSSSDDELERFQGVAVSGEQIAALAQQQAKSASKRKGSQPTHAGRAQGPSGHGTAGASEQSKQVDGDNTQNNQLDIIQQRIATALDHILERQLSPLLASTSGTTDAAAEGLPLGSDAAANMTADVKGSKSKKKQKKAAKAQADAAALDHTNGGADADDGAVRLFRRVKPGTPCVLVSEPSPQPELQVHSAPKRQRRKDASLPATADELASLAVDGESLLAQAVQGLAKDRLAKAKLPAPGTVVDPKVFVPHDHRIAVLLGRAVPAQAASVQ